MGLKEDLEKEVADIFKATWTERDGQQVPEPEALKLGNDAVNLDATALYADMSDSTTLVDDHKPAFAAEVYKAYLTCAARIIGDSGGSITAYDGDRIMALFIGDRKNSNAATAALKLNHAVLKIINPALAAQYPSSSFKLAHVVGLDTSTLFSARIGIRKYNDIVWVGRAANYAAKLSALDGPNMVFITDAVFRRLNDDAKHGGNPRRLMWKPRQWTAMGNMSIHRSSWTLRV
jgi:class 3 adenylate cyclase